MIRGLFVILVTRRVYDIRQQFTLKLMLKIRIKGLKIIIVRFF